MTASVDTVQAGTRPVLAAGLDLDRYRNDVQTLRGLAVLGVVLYHADLLRGGFVGVDVFFVISGFVIGRVLFRSLASAGSVKPQRFYSKRVLRILPALAVMLVVVVLRSPFLAPLAAQPLAAPTGAGAALFSANFVIPLLTPVGYFAPAAEVNPLLHSWSLSVEEQFYFVVPALLLLCWSFAVRRPAARRWLWTLLAAGAALSLALCIGLTYGRNLIPHLPLNLRQPVAFFSPVTRAWEFLAGMVLVTLPVPGRLSPLAARVLRATGVALVLLAYGWFSDATVFPGIAALLPVVGAALAIYAGSALSSRGAADGQGPSPRWITSGSAAFVWLGALSYSWYLWHWPAIVYARAFAPAAGRWVVVVAAAASLVPAVASYRWVEQRFRKRPIVPARGPIFAAVLCIVLPLVAAVCAVGARSAVLNSSEIARFSAAAAAHVGDENGCATLPYVGAAGVEHCTWHAGGARGSVVLVGDSNAGQFVEAFRDATAGTGLSFTLANKNACPFVPVRLVRSGAVVDDCFSFVNRSLRELEANPPAVVAIAGSTYGYNTLTEYQMIDPRTGQLVTEPAARRRLFERELGATIARLRRAGSRVLVVNQSPQVVRSEAAVGRRTPVYRLSDCSPLAIWVRGPQCLGASSFPTTASVILSEGHQIERQAAAAGGAEVLDMTDRICPAGLCSTLQKESEVVTWRDGGHLSVPMSALLAPAVRSRLLDLTSGG